mmetsp:Transcript_1696/g.3606  ORF Transcript_1696/g.3606 Transcript_1696/m.3606 type:complete len:87 (+) Transcript_1696:213-473(+)
MAALIGVAGRLFFPHLPHVTWVAYQKRDQADPERESCLSRQGATGMLETPESPSIQILRADKSGGRTIRNSNDPFPPSKRDAARKR